MNGPPVAREPSAGPRGESGSERPSGLPRKVELIEVGPRDGFQMESRLIPTELKIEVIEQLAASGVREIEAVSFVSPRVIPQMHDADRVMARLLESRRKMGCQAAGTKFSALAPNLRGAERALEAGVDAVHLVIAATETYNQRNVGMSIERSLAALAKVERLVDGAVPLSVTLAVTFGCPFEGRIDLGRLLELARRVAESGIDRLGLADTAGLGHPLLIRGVVHQVQEALPDARLRMHLHDTRGLGLANALAAMEEGVGIIDTALGGLGGCPVMTGASGNLATEDFLNLCTEIGIECPSSRSSQTVSIEAVRCASRRIATFLGRELPSRVLQCGTREELMTLNCLSAGVGSG